MNGLAYVDRLVEVLDSAGIEYAIVGGLAAIAWGVPRFTQGVDLVADLPANLDELARLGERMRAAGLSPMEPDHFAEVAANSVRNGVTFSFMTPAAEKIDISPISVRSEVGQVAAMVLGLRCRLETAGGRMAWFATPEGTIIGKLYFYWLGSDRQIRDIANVLQVQAAAGKELDVGMIGTWARGFDPGLYQAWLETLDALGLESGGSK
jgi:hypothetical protein